jgi:hypothetical protein
MYSIRYMTITYTTVARTSYVISYIAINVKKAPEPDRGNLIIL